tara:strand:- start:3819 stop:4121 length:303 start_codon:yes stop_codon:yes gene_type:complete
MMNRIEFLKTAVLGVMAPVLIKADTPLERSEAGMDVPYDNMSVDELAYYLAGLNARKPLRGALSPSQEYNFCPGPQFRGCKHASEATPSPGCFSKGTDNI